MILYCKKIDILYIFKIIYDEILVLPPTQTTNLGCVLNQIFQKLKEYRLSQFY